MSALMCVSVCICVCVRMQCVYFVRSLMLVDRVFVYVRVVLCVLLLCIIDNVILVVRVNVVLCIGRR